MRTLRIAAKITALNFRARLEYRGGFASNILFGVLWQSATLAFAAVLVGHFHHIGDFPASGVVLIIGMRLLSHGIYVIFFDSFAFLPMLVDEGRLDGYFLRPLPVFTQVLLSTFSVNGLGDVVVGATSFFVALTLVHVHWTIAKVAFMAIAIVSGALVEAALQTALGCLLLRSPGSRMLGSWIDELLSSFGNYPLSIFPPVVRGMFTFVLPLAFIAYLPARLILGIAATHGAEAWLTRLSPLVGIGMFLAARRLFNWSLRHYVHAGG